MISLGSGQQERPTYWPLPCEKDASCCGTVFQALGGPYCEHVSHDDNAGGDEGRTCHPVVSLSSIWILASASTCESDEIK